VNNQKGLTMFVDRCLFVLLSFCSFNHCVVCPSIYGFWLPLWCHQTLLKVIPGVSLLLFKQYWKNIQGHITDDVILCIKLNTT